MTLVSLCACQKGPSLGPGDSEYLASAAEVDCGFVQNSYGQRISWKSNIPVRIHLHKNFPPEYEEALQKAAGYWNDAAGMTLFLFTRADDDLAEKATRDNVNAIHWLLDWPEEKKGYQGLTSLYWKSSQLFEADIAINNKDFNFFTGEKPTTISDVHLESLMVHELGHALGLKHRSTVPSVMWSVLSGGVIRVELTAADRETLKCEY